MVKQFCASVPVAAVLLLWSVGAGALPNPAFLLPGCGSCAHSAELSALEGRISRAPNLDEAKELALAPIDQAHQALSRARWLAPYSSSIRTAQRRIVASRAGVHSAQSKAEVAREFGQLVRLADSGGTPTEAHILSSCHYSTGEIIAIVIGFILGILPGIILLILLC